MKIGFIGVGSMGRAIIPLLVRAGHHVSAWNRSPAVIRDLEGISVLESPLPTFARMKAGCIWLWCRICFLVRSLAGQ